MGPEYHWWWPMWFFPGVMPFIMLLVVIAALYFIFGRGVSRPPWCGPGEERYPESALDILKKRYAKGELTKEEFERMKQDILS